MSDKNPPDKQVASSGKLGGLMMIAVSVAIIALTIAGAFSRWSSNDIFANAELVLGFAIVFLIYRGVRKLFTGHWAVAVLLVPFIYIGAVGLGYVAKDAVGEQIASLLDKDGLRNVDEDNPFKGRNAQNTNVEDLDALMEEW